VVDSFNSEKLATIRNTDWSAEKARLETVFTLKNKKHPRTTPCDSTSIPVNVDFKIAQYRKQKAPIK
jgi:hypothetical protein